MVNKFLTEEKVMKMGRKSKFVRLMVSGLAALAILLMLVGCSGGDGAAGPAGAAGAPGAPGAPGQNLLAPQGLAEGKVTAVTVPTPAAVEGTVVEFELLDAENGNLVPTLPADATISFTYVKLDANGQWQSYIMREGAITGTSNVGSAPGNKPAITTPVAQATTQGNAGQVVNLGGGKYKYTFTTTGLTTTNLTTPVTYAANATNRIGVQVAGGGAHYNMYKDFVPAGGPVTASRSIVTTAPCLDCHQGGSFGFHHSGERNEVEYCVTCHNPGSTDPNSGHTIDLANMVHKIHMGKELPSVMAGTPYIIWGNSGSKHDYSEVGYPQDLRNCTKCHAKVTEGTTVLNPNFEQWKKHPTRLACGACHDNVNFATGAGHGLIGGVRTDDSMCSFCHDEVNIQLSHLPVIPPDPNSTFQGGTNSRTNAAYVAAAGVVPAGAAKITYEIKEVTVGGTPKRASVKFRMLKDGTPVTFNTYVNASTQLLDNFVGSTNIYVAYAVPQDGITAPGDFNKTANVYLKDLLNPANTKGVLTFDAASGYYTATIGTGAAASTSDIPASAVMVTGGIGYAYSLSATAQPFTQTNVSGYPYYAADTTVNGVTYKAKTGGLIVAAPNVWKVATGYTGRRAIVENARCNKCHAQLGVSPSFHVGQRNDGPTCSFCHMPNQTSSGWAANASTFIHGIHGASKRGADNPFTWHSVSATEGYWLVAYPAALNSCEACHLPGTYDFSAAASASAVTGNKLLYTTVGTGTWTLTDDATKGNYKNGTSYTWFVAPEIKAAITAGTATYGSGFAYDPATNVTTPAAATTLVTSPIAAACYSCHVSTVAQAHMKANGGSIYEARATALTKLEQCIICHGPGKTADIKAVHAKTAAE